MSSGMETIARPSHLRMYERFSGPGSERRRGAAPSGRRGDQEALRDLFSRYRDRLKRMVHLRLSRRLAGRVDDSDVLQEAFLDIARRLDEY